MLACCGHVLPVSLFVFKLEGQSVKPAWQRESRSANTLCSHCSHYVTREWRCVNSLVPRWLEKVVSKSKYVQNILTVIYLWLNVKLYVVFVFLEDKLEQQHALFTQYKDPCRLGSGEDKPWALGNDTFAQIAQKPQHHIVRICNHYILLLSASKVLQFYECLKIETILHTESWEGQNSIKTTTFTFLANNCGYSSLDFMGPFLEHNFSLLCDTSAKRDLHKKSSHNGWLDSYHFISACMHIDPSGPEKSSVARLGCVLKQQNPGSWF